MSNTIDGKTLPELDPAGDINGADLVYVTQNNTDKKATADQLSIFFSRSVTLITGTLNANGLVGVIPARSVLIAASLEEIGNHTVTVSLGTTIGSTFDVLFPIQINPLGIIPVGLNSLSNAIWKVDQDIFINSSNWNGAIIDVVIWYLSPPLP